MRVGRASMSTYAEGLRRNEIKSLSSTPGPDPECNLGAGYETREPKTEITQASRKHPATPPPLQEPGWSEK
jgi:hypothetical protein